MKFAKALTTVAALALFASSAFAGYTLTISPKRGSGKDTKVEYFDDYKDCLQALKACKSKVDDQHICWCK